MRPPIRFNQEDDNVERTKDTLLRMEGYVTGYRNGLSDGWNDCIDALKKLKNEKNDKIIFRKLEEVKNEKI